MYRAVKTKMGWTIQGPQGHVCQAVSEAVAVETAKYLNEFRHAG